MAAPRKIIHVDMDAFYASVEQRDDPSLRGRPVVVAWRGARSVVCAASYEARKFGVHSAMPALRAERLCPEAAFVAPDFPRYKAVSRQIHDIFGRHTSLIEPLSLDEAYLDVTAAESGLPSATACAEAIRASIREETGLTASAGIAPNKFLAKIASDWNKPDGQFVVRPREVDAFLMTLKVGLIPGVGKVMQARLAELGVHTVGRAARHWHNTNWSDASAAGAVACMNWHAASTSARSATSACCNRSPPKTPSPRTCCWSNWNRTSAGWPPRPGPPTNASTTTSTRAWPAPWC